MKRVLSFALALAMVLAIGTVGVQAAATYGTAVNNNTVLLVGNTTAIHQNAIVSTTAAPAIVNGAVMIPVETAQQLMNASLIWEAQTDVFDLAFGKEKTAQMVIGSLHCTVNGRGVTMNAAPTYYNNTTYIPLQPLVEDVIGKTYFYDPSTNVVVISAQSLLSSSDTAVLSTLANAISTRTLPAQGVGTAVTQEMSFADGTIANLDKILEEMKQTTVVETTGPVQPTVDRNLINVQPTWYQASQQPEDANPAANAFDGMIDTGWACEGSGSLTVTFPSAITLSKIYVGLRRYEDGRTLPIIVEGSTDGTNFTSLYNETVSAASNYDITLSPNQAFKAVRVNANGNSTSNWATVGEFQFSSPDAASINVPAAGTGGAATAEGAIAVTAAQVSVSSQPEAANGAAQLVDGSTSTYWAVEGSANAQIDLKTKQMIQSVTVDVRRYDDGRSVPYTLQIAETAGNWKEVASFESSPTNNYTQSHAINAEARFVRVTVNGSSTGSWSSIAEITIYGGGGAAGGTAASGMSQAADVTQGSMLISQAGTDQVLTVQDDNLTIAFAAYEAGNRNQLWNFDGMTASTITNAGSGKLLDVSGGSTTEGGDLIVWDATGGDNQNWTLEQNGAAYLLKSVFSGFNLTAGAGIKQTAAGTPIIVADASAPYAAAGSTASGGAIQAATTRRQFVGKKRAIVLSGTPTVLAVVSGKPAFATANTGLEEHLWTIQNRGADYYYLYDSEGKLLTAKDGELALRNADFTYDQVWEIVAMDEEGTTYSIRNAATMEYITIEGLSLNSYNAFTIGYVR